VKEQAVAMRQTSGGGDILVLVPHSVPGLESLGFSTMTIIRLETLRGGAGIMKKLLVVIIGIALFLGLFSIGSATAAANLPNLIIWTSYDIGTSTYMQTACMADGVTKKTGLRLRVMPSGNEMSRLLPVRGKQAHFAATSSVSTYGASNGLWDFARYDWGPQPLRQFLPVTDYDQAISIGTTASANIKTLNDLKGKRLTWIPGAPAINLAMEASLAFAGLTWDDVIKIPAPSLATSMQFLGEGQADAAWCTTNSPVMLELERNPHGLYWPEYPPEDKAGWERMNKIAPFFVPARGFVFQRHFVPQEQGAGAEDLDIGGGGRRAAVMPL